MNNDTCPTCHVSGMHPCVDTDGYTEIPDHLNRPLELVTTTLTD